MKNYDHDLMMEEQRTLADDAEMIACPSCGAAVCAAEHVRGIEEKVTIKCGECDGIFPATAAEPYRDPFAGEPESTDPARDAANLRELARQARRLMGER